MRNRYVPDGSCTLRSQDKFKEVQNITALGVCLDTQGHALASAMHRRGCALGVLRRHAGLLRSRYIPLRDRAHLAFKTVKASFLHGAGGWPLCAAVADIAAALDRSIWRLLLGDRRRGDETWRQFTTRTKRARLKHASDLKVVPLWHLVVQRYLSWAGHVVRLAHGGQLRAPLAWRSSTWWETVQAARSDHRASLPRHPSSGWVRGWESCLFTLLGPDWQELALGRAAWTISADRHQRDLCRMLLRP